MVALPQNPLCCHDDLKSSNELWVEQKIPSPCMCSADSFFVNYFSPQRNPRIQASHHPQKDKNLLSRVCSTSIPELLAAWMDPSVNQKYKKALGSRLECVVCGYD